MEIQIDGRGLLRFCKSDGSYMAFGIECSSGLASNDSADSPRFTPRRSMQIWFDNDCFFWKSSDGNRLPGEIPLSDREEYRGAILEGVQVLGFKVSAET